MAENNNNDTTLLNEVNCYSESKGTGVISSILFIVFAIAIMVVVSHFVN